VVYLEDIIMPHVVVAMPAVAVVPVLLVLVMVVRRALAPLTDEVIRVCAGVHKGREGSVVHAKHGQVDRLCPRVSCCPKFCCTQECVLLVWQDNGLIQPGSAALPNTLAAKRAHNCCLHPCHKVFPAVKRKLQPMCSAVSCSMCNALSLMAMHT